jgi:hypothetical protein
MTFDRTVGRRRNRLNRTHAFLRRGALAALAMLAAAALTAAVGVPRASAGFGQIGSSWGGYGTGNAEFAKPTLFGVDPVDGGVYAGDEVSEESFRIQKLSPTGTFEASVLIPRTVEEGKLVNLHGIAVDHEKGRFYLIEGCRVAVGTASPCTSPGGRFAALRVRIFNTAPTGETLVPAATASLALPTGEEELYKPQNIAVDPGNHDLVILAEDKDGHPVIQRFNEDTGASIHRFVDSTSVLKQGTKIATSIAVAPDHTTYTVIGAQNSPGAADTRAMKLPEDLSSLTEVSSFASTAESEAWQYGLSTYTSTLMSAPQIAISPDGDTLYFKEVRASSGEDEGGSILVRGYSLSHHETSVLYGGGESGSCEITTTSSGIAAVGDRLAVFDFGPLSEGSAPPFGDRVVTFGPGGTGCPQHGADESFKLTITKEGSGSGTVTAIPLGISCGSDCEEEYTEGHKVKLTAAAAGGSEFKGWTTGSGSAGTCTGTASPCEVTMSAAVGLKAKFDAEPGQEGLTVNKGGDGGGSFECDSGSGFGACAPSYLQGSTITIKAVPDSHSSFAGWSGGGCSGTGNCVISNIQSSTTVTGTLNLIMRTLTLTKAGSGNGSFQCDSGSGLGACAASYADGTTVTIQANPDSSSTFAGWSGGGCSGTGTCVVFEIAANTSVTGTFNPIPRILTISKAGTGNGSFECNSGSGFGACAGSYPNGTSVTIQATPDSSSTFAGWSGEGCSGTGTCTLTMSFARSVVGTFDAKPPPVEPPPPTGTPPPTTNPPPTHPSSAELLRKRRQRALKKCRKLKGKARAKCIKRAKAIGKRHKRTRRRSAGTRGARRLHRGRR